MRAERIPGCQWRASRLFCMFSGWGVWVPVPVGMWLLENDRYLTFLFCPWPCGPKLICMPDLAFTAICWSPVKAPLTHLSPSLGLFFSEHLFRLPFCFLAWQSEGKERCGGTHRAGPRHLDEAAHFSRSPGPPCPVSQHLFTTLAMLQVLLTHEFILEWRFLSFVAVDLETNLRDPQSRPVVCHSMANGHWDHWGGVPCLQWTRVSSCGYTLGSWLRLGSALLSHDGSRILQPLPLSKTTVG